MNSETIQSIGIWSLRITLVVGAIYAACQSKPDVAESLIVALVLSFIFL